MAIATYGNVEAGEQVDKTIRFQFPPPSELTEDPYVSSGRTETWSYRGSYAAMLAQAEGYRGAASKEDRYDITLKRIIDSGKAELTVNYSTYVRKNDTEEEGGEGGSGDGEPGESKEQPTIAIETNCVEQPILLHPKFNLASGSEDTLLGLKAYQDGASPSDYIEYNGTEYTVLELCQNAPDVFGYLKKGVTSYMMPVIEVSCQYKSSTYNPRNDGVGKIVSSIPGYNGLGKKKALFMGCGISKDSEGIFHYDERYKIADWDEGLYSD